MYVHMRACACTRVHECEWLLFAGCGACACSFECACMHACMHGAEAELEVEAAAEVKSKSRSKMNMSKLKYEPKAWAQTAPAMRK